MRRLFACIILSFIAFAAHAQYGCNSPMVVNKNSIGPVSPGGLPDSSLAKKDNTVAYFEKPHSVIWFTFTVPEDTTLTFDIIPSNGKDDLDFLLFKAQNSCEGCTDEMIDFLEHEGGTFCEKVENHTLKPVRSNIANTAQTINGMTGLSVKAIHETELLGKHPAYSKAIEVKKGEKYCLAVDNYTDPTGTFTLKLHLRWPVATSPPPRKPNLVPLSGIKLNIIICDSAGKPVITRLKIAYAHSTHSAGIIKDTAGVSVYTLTVQPREKLRITCLSTGYLLSQSFFMAPEEPATINDTIRLEKIREHGNMTLQDIEFEPDQSVFLPKAQEPLSNLLDFMQNNPSVKILIKGYVNDPQSRNASKFDQALSEQRAQAVLTYLAEHGIDAKRMDWKGFGNKDMLYPEAQTVEQQQANRRVEIEVK